MRHVLFGQSGLRVSELCLDAMVSGDARELGASRKDSQEIFEAFASAGGSFIDTADHYADGESERLVGEFVASERDSFVISTKWSVARHGGLQRSGNGRRNMMRAVEASLRRLKTDRIDLYSLHAWDYATPCEEIMRGLDDLVRGGKGHYVAIFDTPAWEVSRANMLAELRGWSPFAGLQVEYSLAARTPERDLLPMAKTLGFAVMAWSPLAGGALSGKYSAKAAQRQPDPGRHHADCRRSRQHCGADGRKPGAGRTGLGAAAAGSGAGDPHHQRPHQGPTREQSAKPFGATVRFPVGQARQGQRHRTRISA